MDPYGPNDSIALTDYLHRRGINMRLLGMVQSEIKRVKRLMCFSTIVSIKLHVNQKLIEV